MESRSAKGIVSSSGTKSYDAQSLIFSFPLPSITAIFLPKLSGSMLDLAEEDDRAKKRRGR